ncbi:hypothetical protein J0H58_10505 [bacterium]|nr:hypothetical protein [bacterium]
MIRFWWENEVRAVRRVVIRRDLPAGFTGSVRGLAGRLGLSVVLPDAAPRPGDLWLGCSPDADWQVADPRAVTWVALPDIEDALAALRDRVPAAALSAAG